MACRGDGVLIDATDPRNDGVGRIDTTTFPYAIDAASRRWRGNVDYARIGLYTTSTPPPRPHKEKVQ